MIWSETARTSKLGRDLNGTDRMRTVGSASGACASLTCTILYTNIRPIGVGAFMQPKSERIYHSSPSGFPLQYVSSIFKALTYCHTRRNPRHQSMLYTSIAKFCIRTTFRVNLQYMLLGSDTGLESASVIRGKASSLHFSLPPKGNVRF